MSALDLGTPSFGTPLTVEEIDHRAAFRALAPAWEALARRAGTAGPFFHPYWFAVYAADLERERLAMREVPSDATPAPPAPRSIFGRAKELVAARLGRSTVGVGVERSPFGPGDSRALRLLVAHARGVLAGVLPLVAERRRIAGVPVRVLRSLSDDHSQRFDLLADGPEPVDALWRQLAADPTWDVLELRDLPPGSHGEALIARAAADGCPTGTWASLNSPYLPLPPTVKNLEAALDGKFKANLRRRARRLAEEVGPLRLERIERGAELEQALSDGFALEASGWKGEGGTAIAKDLRLDARYRSLARVFAGRRELALYFLRAGERRVAFHFATESDGVYYLFKPGYDEALAKYGLGHLLFMEVAKDLIGRGAREIDFLGDDMPWKRDWTDKLRQHAFHYVMRPTPAGRALAAWKFQGLPAVRTFAEAARARFEALRSRMLQRNKIATAVTGAAVPATPEGDGK